MSDAANIHVAGMLAAWASGFEWEKIPPNVREKARTVWLDTLGCLLLGADHPETMSLGATLARRDPSGRTASAVGPFEKLAPQDAILVNGLAVGVNVFDEGHKAARGHVAGYVLPAVLTVAEIEAAPFRRALEAFVVGYEIAARIGSATRIRATLHPSGTWGVIGAAAAIAHLRGANAAELSSVIQLAANLTLATSWGAAVEGATVRDIYSAMPSFLGFLVVDLAQAGFRGAATSIETTFGEISGDAFDAERCVDGLGDVFAILQGYIKPYPCCRSFHATLDATLAAVSALGRSFDPSRDQVTIGTDTIAFNDNRDLHAENALAARESLPVTTAIALLNGRVGPDLYLNGAYSDREVLALAERITIREASRASQDARPGWAEIRLQDGSCIRRDALYPSGDPANPLSMVEVRQKFVANAQRRLGSYAEEAAERILHGDLATPMTELLPAWLVARRTETAARSKKGVS